jgi:hypothetical protein
MAGSAAIRSTSSNASWVSIITMHWVRRFSASRNSGAKPPYRLIRLWPMPRVPSGG